MLTPYPGHADVASSSSRSSTETDWEQFDGFTPTFTHPNLTASRAAVPARRRLHAVLHAAVVPGELPADHGRAVRRLGPTGWIGASRAPPRPRGDRATCRERSHADSDLALRSAGPPEHRADRSRAARTAASSSRVRTSREFERAFADDVGARPCRHRVVRPHGVLLHPAGASTCRRASEIILPALTFWVMPELARVAGLKPVFADVDPHTFTLDPAAFERAITPAHQSRWCPRISTGCRATWTQILEIARRHKSRA